MRKPHHPLSTREYWAIPVSPPLGALALALIFKLAEGGSRWAEAFGILAITLPWQLVGIIAFRYFLRRYRIRNLPRLESTLYASFGSIFITTFLTLALIAAINGHPPGLFAIRGTLLVIGAFGLASTLVYALLAYAMFNPRKKSSYRRPPTVTRSPAQES